MPERQRRATFTGLTISALLITSGGVACGANSQTEQSGLIQPAADTLSPEQVQRNTQVIETLKALPDSAVKSALLDRAVPYLEMTRLDNLPFGQTTLPFLPTEIIFKTSDDPSILIKGEFKERGASEYQEAHYPQEYTVIKLPVANLLTPQEAADPQLPKTTAGIPLIEVEFYPDTPFYDEFSPQITIEVNPQIDLNHPQVQALINFIKIKETCQFLLMDVELRHMVSAMEADGLQMFIRDKNGQMTNAVSQAKMTLLENGGRSVAAYDIACHIVAVQAVADVPQYREILANDKLIGPLLNEMLSMDLGQTPDEIWENSLNWALTSPSARNIWYAGSMNVFPN